MSVRSIGSGTFPPGEYYIGDPCYVTTNEDWEDWCLTQNFKEGIVCETKTGNKWAIFSTHYGDGIYEGTNEFLYHVDAGCIGIVPASMFDSTKGRTEYGTYHKCSTKIHFKVTENADETIFKFWDDDKNGLEIHT